MHSRSSSKPNSKKPAARDPKPPVFAARRLHSRRRAEDLDTLDQLLLIHEHVRGVLLANSRLFLEARQWDRRLAGLLVVSARPAGRDSHSGFMDKASRAGFPRLNTRSLPITVLRRWNSMMS